MVSMCVSIDQQSAWEYFFDNILVLKSGGGGGGCDTPSIPLLPFGKSLIKYSTTIKFCKVKIYEKYRLGSFIFGRFTI